MTSSRSASNPVRVRFAEFELDEANARLLRDGLAVALAPTPFAVLCALARQPSALLTKDALLDSVWGHQFVSDSVLKTAISDLRTALGDDARKPRFIETVSRRGYRFIATPTAAPAHPASGEQTASASVPVSAPQPSSFVGRAEALQRLNRAWNRACSGQRTMVWIAGEPGIGKTMLIDQFVAGLGHGACARGQCLENYGAGEPYLPVLEALAALCRADASVPNLLRTAAPTWLLQLPWLSTAQEREALRRELAGVGPERMVRELGEALDRYTQDRPLLLVTEDLHWSDRATIQLIDYLARRRGSARLMWLASFRLAEAVALDHPLNRLRHELRLHGLCEEIVLDPFSESEVAAYVAQRSASLAQDVKFVRDLHERTDGVPLFVASVLKEAIERGAQAEEAGAAPGTLVANIGIPENLLAIIDHHIARLGGEQRALLSAAAVCGLEFRVDTLSLVLERDPMSVSHTCDELAREQLWLAAPRATEAGEPSEPPYSFRHALFRQVLYERTAPAARAQLHAKVGTALEREHASGIPVAASELAMHFDRGRQPLAALRHYAQAAHTSLQQLSPAACLSLTERASVLLAQVPQGRERDELEITIATLRGASAVHALGVGSEAKSAFQRAYSLLDRVPRHPMRELLLHGYGFLLCLRAEYPEALAVAERAEALSSETNDPALLLAAGIVHAEVDQLQGRPGLARAWSERGLAAVEPLASTLDGAYVADPQVTLLGMIAVELVHLGLVQQAHARLERAHERARHLRQPMSRLVALWYDALFSVRLGDADRVASLADQMDTLVEEFALAQGRTACQWFRGWAQARKGAPLEGYRRIRDAYDENTRLGMLSGGSEVLGYAAEALLRAGDLDAAQRELEEAFRVAESQVERVFLPQLFLIEAGIARARGLAPSARTSARRAVNEARAQGAPGLELLALIELCEHSDPAPEDRQALAALVKRVPEAREISDRILQRVVATSPRTG